MTVKELRERAKELGIFGYYKLNKAELEKEISLVELKLKEIDKPMLQKIIPDDVKIIEYSDNEEWENIRGNRIGGSDSGAVIGVNPYKTAIDVYIDKTEGSDFKGNKYTHWGHKLEKNVFEEFQDEHNDLYCYTVPYTLKRDCLVANLDGLIYDPISEKWGVLEIKTANAYAGKEWNGETIPDSYFAQVQHYLYVTGLDFAYVACLIGGNTYKEFYVERSEEDINYLVNKVTDFWNNNILKGIPPMPDGTEAYSKYLLKKTDSSNDEIIELETIDNKGQEYKAIKNEIEALEKKKKLIEQEILKTMNENDCKKAKSENFKFTIVCQNRATFDKKRFFEENEELQEMEKQYTTIKENKFLKVS